MSATVEFTTLFSVCCPMENTLRSLDTLADPVTASLILGFKNKSIKKDFKSFNFLSHTDTIYVSGQYNLYCHHLGFLVVHQFLG